MLVVILLALLVPLNVLAVDKCTLLLADMTYCANRRVSCENWETLISCAEDVASKVSMCDDEVARNIITHQYHTYNLTYYHFCDPDNFEESSTKEDCLPNGSKVAPLWTILSPQFLTTKGCQFHKTYLKLLARQGETRSCHATVFEWVDEMYNMSSCENETVDIITRQDISNLNEFFTGIVYCGRHQPKYPSCNGKSGFLSCVGRMITNSELQHDYMKTVEQNILDVVTESDHLLCSTEEYKSEFKWAQDCLNYLSTMLEDLRMQINGYYTEIGCEGLKYKNYFLEKEYQANDCATMFKFWLDLKSGLKCTQAELDAVNTTTTDSTTVLTSQIGD